MRGAAPVLMLCAVLGAGGCTDAPASPGVAVPTGPCAAAREQPADGSQERRAQADLDGDGRTDEVVSWVRGSERVTQAWLATGENALPEALFEGEVLATADVDGDRRAEVFAATGDGTGRAFVLDGCRLVPVTLARNARIWDYAVGPGAQLLCRPGGVVEEAVTQGPETVRRAWTLAAGKVTGADPVGTGPVASPGIRCG